LFWGGVLLLLVGSGPLLTVILLASLGLTKDPKLNPVGFGIIAFLTFWPSVILIVVGAVQSWRRYTSSRPLPLRNEGPSRWPPK